MRSDTIKRHIKIHIDYKEKLDQNTKGVHLAPFSNDILPAKDNKKYRGNTQEEDNEKDSCNNEDEQITEGRNLNANI